MFCDVGHDALDDDNDDDDDDYDDVDDNDGDDDHYGHNDVRQAEITNLQLRAAHCSSNS